MSRLLSWCFNLRFIMKMSHFITYLMIAFLFACLPSSYVLAETHEVKCENLAHDFDLPAERYIWLKSCNGEIADLNRSSDFGGKLKALDSGDWPSSRVITSRFIRKIFSGPYRSLLSSSHGVSILGGRFKEAVELRNFEFKLPLYFLNTRFEKNVDFGQSHFKYGFKIGGSLFNGDLNLKEAVVKGSFNLYGNVSKALSEFKNESRVRLEGSEISGSAHFVGGSYSLIDMSGATVGRQTLFKNLRARYIDLSGSNLHQSLIFRLAKVTSKVCDRDGGLNLNRAFIKGMLEIDNSKFDCPTKVDMVQVENSSQISSSTFNDDVHMDNANFSSRLSFSDSIVEGNAYLRNLHVGSTLAFRDRSKIQGALFLTGAKILGLTILSGESEFHGQVAMNGLKAMNSLCLCDGAIFYKGVGLNNSLIDGTLDLATGWDYLREKRRSELRKVDLPHGKYSESKDLVDLSDVSSSKIELPAIINFGRLKLDGLTYNSFEFQNKISNNIQVNDELSWFKEWLEKAPYSEQSYYQVATILENNGQNDISKEVLYLGKKREHDEKGWCKSFWDLVLYLTIGYGYKIERSFFSIGVLLLLGAIFISLDRSRESKSCLWKIFFSLDRMIPLVELDKRFSDYEISVSYVRYYFYIHHILGYVLATFVAAGLAGLVV